MVSAMTETLIKKVVIVGGGTAGWMTAAAIGRFFGHHLSVTLIESDQIGTVGVGEATIPHIRQFNSMLGIDENAFIQEVNATYKLGIRFEGWGTPDSVYMHPFGDHGHDINGVDFHQFWLYLNEAGMAPPLGEFSVPAVAAANNRFEYPHSDPQSPLSNFGYAFHIDASRYAKYLRGYSEKHGVERMEGQVVQVDCREDNGFIDSVLLSNGSKIEGDLFIDCSGFRALLIEGALKTGFEDWSHWLPCDRAIALPCEKQSSDSVYTRSIAHSAGWQWRIPLQNRVGNGLVYCSNYLNDDQALQTLQAGLEGAALAPPNPIKFTTGARRKSWHKNCVAIGLSSGFLEPLESTSIYLIQIAIQALLEHFPSQNFLAGPVAELNTRMSMEYERVRDFLILHYKANKRSEPFWQDCAEMSIPGSLERKMALFKQTGHVESYRNGLFMTPSWVAVYIGQGYLPNHIDARVKHFPRQKVQEYLQSIRDDMTRVASSMPDANNFLKTAIAHGPAGHYPKSSMSLYGTNT